MRLKIILNSLINHNKYNINEDDILDHQEKYKNVMIELLYKDELSRINSFEDKSRVHVLTKIFDDQVTKGNYDNIIKVWSDIKEIKTDFYQKIMLISNDINFNVDSIKKCGLENHQYKILAKEVNESTFNSSKKEEMITIICERLPNNLKDLDKLMSYNFDLNEEYLIFLCIFLKVCVTIKPVVGLSCAYYLSNDINNFRSFKLLLKDKIDSIQINNFKRLPYKG